MVGHHEDDETFLRNFGHSLTGPALGWYQSIDLDLIPNWEDLSEQFIRSFEDRIRGYFTRANLLNIRNGKDESFELFARRWKKHALMVQPPLSEREMLEFALKSLPAEYFNRMYSYGYSSFQHLVDIGMRIE